MDYLRTAVRFRSPPPIYKGQPLSVGLFLCGVLRVCGGSCGCLRTSLRSSVVRLRAPFALSRPFFSPPRQRQKFEVRKHQNFACYKSGTYSRTFQAVGWRHCLPGGNSLTEAALLPKSGGVAISACSICLVMAGEGRAATSCSAPIESIITPSRSSMSQPNSGVWRGSRAMRPFRYTPVINLA
jgi:hypothetical protein